MNRFTKLSGKHFANYDAAGTLQPMTEIVIVTKQTGHVIDTETGALAIREKAQSLSFVASVEEMRQLAEQLRGVAVQAESKLTLAVSGNGVVS